MSFAFSWAPAPNKTPARHQYIDRASGSIRDERLYFDSLVNFIYSDVRELAPNLFRALMGARTSRYLGFLNYDLALGTKLLGPTEFARRLGVHLSECLEDPATLDTARKFFERKIKYWECRPMPAGSDTVVSPADARVLVGSLCEISSLFIKEKFFSDAELLGPDRRPWVKAFKDGDFALFRLTPEKYHYNHTPVAGNLVDFYQVDGEFHSCNPGSVVAIATPYSKNKRVVSIIDTDVPGGTRVGLVAIVEVAALMIGEIVQVYSVTRYESPSMPRIGQFLFKGAPKSLYRPGSSTDVLLFQAGRIRFDNDLVINMSHPIFATLLFLKGVYVLAFLTAIGATNLARVWLELLRADHRGNGRFSAYQVMALISVIYCLSIAALASVNIPNSRPDLFAGFRAIWMPEVLLFVVALWIVVFLYTGRSSVTESRVSFYVLRHKT